VLVDPEQHGMSIRFPEQGVSIVERLTAVHMDARTCSRVRAHGRGRRCGGGSQARRARPEWLERDSYQYRIPQTGSLRQLPRFPQE